MISLPWHKLLTRRAAMLALSLLAVACLPLASQELVRDAGLTLLLPYTLAGFLSAWVVAALPWRDRPACFALAAAGPVLLVLFVGHVWEPLLRLLELTLLLLPGMLEWRGAAAWPQASAWPAALNELGAQSLLIGGRLAAWLVRGGANEDPIARALAWGMGSWWLAVWAGWQIRRHARPLAGLAPATLLLGVLLVGSHRPHVLLWVYLAAFLAILGLVKYDQQLEAWRRAEHDYVEFTNLYSYVSIALLTGLLAGAAYFAYATSLQEFLDRLEERRAVSAAEGGPPGTSAGKPSGRPDRSTELLQAEALLGPHRILGGPELSDRLVMLVSTGELPKMPAGAQPSVPVHYWRTMTYERYNGRAWSNPSRQLQEVPAGQDLMQLPDTPFRVIRQRVWFPQGPAGRLYWTDTLLHADVPIQAAWHGGGEGDLLSAFSGEQGYTVESLQVPFEAETLRAASGEYPGWVRERYLELPEAVPARVLALARDLTASAATPYERAMAIEAYLRQLPYSLEVPAPPPDREAADYFLFDLKTGHCDYYATAMVVLSRAAGLPARFVTGYASGTYDPQSASYLVREKDAHAWAEIYFPGTGWVEFEATASQPRPAWQVETGARVIQPEQSPAAYKLVDLFLTMNTPIGWSAWLALIGIIGLAIAWEPARIRLLARFRAGAAPRLFYAALRRSAQRLTGPVPPSQTIREYQRALGGQLASLEQKRWARRWMQPAAAELELLSRLYSASLFAAQAPALEEVKAGGRAWSRLRLRLMAASLIYRLNGKSGSPR